MCVVLVEVGKIGDVEGCGGGDCQCRGNAVPRREISKEALEDEKDSRV